MNIEIVILEEAIQMAGYYTTGPCSCVEQGHNYPTGLYASLIHLLFTVLLAILTGKMVLAIPLWVEGGKMKTHPLHANYGMYKY